MSTGTLNTVIVSLARQIDIYNQRSPTWTCLHQADGRYLQNTLASGSLSAAGRDTLVATRPKPPRLEHADMSAVRAGYRYIRLCQLLRMLLRGKRAANYILVTSLIGYKGLSSRLPLTSKKILYRVTNPDYVTRGAALSSQYWGNAPVC